MYLPDHFKISEAEEIFSFLDANAFGQLVSKHDDRFVVSHLPFLISTDRKHLHCHLARQNPQWRQLEGQQLLVTFQGPHDYVSPSWYQSPGVPTWNYQAVHVYGGCRVFDGASELATLVEALSARYESAFENPWEPQYRDAMLTAIVGVEISIDEILCKYKLSQNRSVADQQGVIDRLEELGSESLVRAMRKTLL
ncbi:MAG: FMN-binding negative transcriptional regulator [Gammaproteobacteria bacterium]|nr:FMN-binding negative transcriptional regulator [Gammaproteobacteria bacterium]MDH3446968.1 FMN-binding negative transcriptional regulator [Gammaproteobacteria bacterium]